ncbi:MAG: NADH-quinone oxidoreductase subunit C [bacterium]|nr:NADH-quinone oxidoreductase subunit C [Acidimicrobiia bacterium]MCY4651232.1 NADH-quinone oxidoreductase subunit C [bacterium]
MTLSPSDAEMTDADGAGEGNSLVDRAADAVGGVALEALETAKVGVSADRWTQTLRIARDDLGLGFFSWLSAIHWTNDPQVGDSLSQEVTERFELLCAVSDVTSGELVVFSTDLEATAPTVDSLIEIYPGADWHEREAREMFGITFVGHPCPENLYLPNEFAGNPLLKSFPLLSREVKPWPGDVDVEEMPAVGGGT